MKTNKWNRRDFVRQSLGPAAVSLIQPIALLSAQSKTEPSRPKPLRLGGPSFAKSDDPEELALAHRKLGYRAAYCPKVALTDEARVKALARAFAKHDVILAEVGPGQGSLDYVTYLRRLAQLSQNAPLMLEHLPNADEYTKAREHLFETARQAGLSFG